jgi:hypothetical protein
MFLVHASLGPMNLMNISLPTSLLAMKMILTPFNTGRIDIAISLISHNLPSMFSLSPPMSDECELLFSSAKLRITDRRSCLEMDLIEANGCLRAWYGKPKKGIFDDKAVDIEEGKKWDDSREEDDEEVDEKADEDVYLLSID